MNNPYSNCSNIERMFNELHPDEIPIFGSSRVEKGYYCDSLGSNFYNYGMPNASFDEIELLLKPELEKNKKTAILIDVHHDFYMHDAYENINIETYLPFINKNRDVREFLSANNRLKAYQKIPGLRYFGFYSDYLQSGLIKNSDLSNVFYNKGGAYDTKITSTENLQKKISAREAKNLHFTVDSAKQNRLYELVRLHPEREFIFVVSPYHKSAKKTVDNFDEMLFYFTTMANQFQNVLFIYFNTDFFEDELWKDTIHLNLYGAQIFSGQLKNVMESKGVFSETHSH